MDALSEEPPNPYEQVVFPTQLSPIAQKRLDAICASLSHVLPKKSAVKGGAE